MVNVKSTVIAFKEGKGKQKKGPCRGIKEGVRGQGPDVKPGGK